MLSSTSPIITKKGFTLAEVLVTLAIIGVVAALTIPSLLTSIHNRDTLVRLKKVYSVFGQAYKGFEAEDFNAVNLWDVVTNGSNYTRDQFCTKLNCIKIGAGSWPDTMYKYLNGTDYGNNSTVQPTALLNDGTLLMFNSFNTNCTSGGSNKWCGAIIADINGHKAPNTLGKDVFYIVFSETTVQPFYYPATDCNTGTNLGVSCAGKVFMEDGINY